MWSLERRERTTRRETEGGERCGEREREANRARRRDHTRTVGLSHLCAPAGCGFTGACLGVSLSLAPVQCLGILCCCGAAAGLAPCDTHRRHLSHRAVQAVFWCTRLLVVDDLGAGVSARLADATAPPCRCATCHTMPSTTGAADSHHSSLRASSGQATVPSRCSERELAGGSAPQGLAAWSGFGAGVHYRAVVLPTAAPTPAGPNSTLLPVAVWSPEAAFLTLAGCVGASVGACVDSRPAELPPCVVCVGCGRVLDVASGKVLWQASCLPGLGCPPPSA